MAWTVFIDGKAQQAFGFSIGWRSAGSFRS